MPEKKQQRIEQEENRKKSLKMNVNKSTDEAVRSEKLRYKNADEIYD